MDRRALGLAGERAAESELVRSGMRVVARNQRTRMGEIDLVCRDREGYVFVEVKTRRAGSFVAAAEAVDRRKLGRLARLGAGWLAMRGERGARWRVLVAALTVGSEGTSVELIEPGPENRTNMATIALPLRRAGLSGVGIMLPLVLGTVGTFTSWFGAGWDVSWHRMLGRDTFWSAPHLFLYAGVTLWGVAGLIATATAMAGRPVQGRELRVGPLRAELGLALVGLGALVVILSAPFDNLWHAIFGRDVDIWSPPHLAGILGGGIGLVGWISAFAPGVFPIDDRLRRFLRLVMLGDLCAVAVFAMNFYYILTVTREGFFYPLLVAALLPAALAVATVILADRWAATKAAASYTVIALIGYALLAGSGWRAPAFPPLIVAGAFAIDLFRARGGRWAHPLAIGFAFSAAFVVAELIRLMLFAPAAPTAGGGIEPRLTALFFQYYEQTVARPWLSLWPAAAAVLGAPLAAVSWLFGRRLGEALADDRHPQAFAHP